MYYTSVGTKQKLNIFTSNETVLRILLIEKHIFGMNCFISQILAKCIKNTFLMYHILVFDIKLEINFINFQNKEYKSIKTSKREK